MNSDPTAQDQQPAPAPDPRRARGFLMLVRGPDTLELLADPDAFCLLTWIAYRARRTNGLNRHDLGPGEALLGDYAAYGLSERRYRTAKAKLAKWDLATFRATNKGTIASLCGTNIYDINVDTGDGQSDGQETDKRRTNDEPRDRQKTSNNNLNKPIPEEEEKPIAIGNSVSSEAALRLRLEDLRHEIGDKGQRLWDALLAEFPIRSDRSTQNFRVAVHYMQTRAQCGNAKALGWLTDAIAWIRQAKQPGIRNPAGRWVSIVQERTGLLPKGKKAKVARKISDTVNPFLR